MHNDDQGEEKKSHIHPQNWLILVLVFQMGNHHQADVLFAILKRDGFGTQRQKTKLYREDCKPDDTYVSHRDIN